MSQEEEGYVLTGEDCLGLAGVRSSMAMLADFARQIGSPSSSQDLDNKVSWLDSFMDRVGATALLVEMRKEGSSYYIDTSVGDRSS